MIYGQTTPKSIEILKQKRERFLAAQERLAAVEPAAIVKRFRLAELDRAYEDDPKGSVNCNCATEPHQSQGAFTAFPSDTAKMLLCCVDCGTIHFIGED